MYELIFAPAGNERGSAMVAALGTLVVLTILGLSAMKTSQTELQITANDLRHKISFYQADGGTELGSELLEQNIACPTGFTNSTIGNIEVVNNDFWLNLDADATIPSDADRDFYFPSNYNGSQPHTNIKLGGNTQFSTGSALQMLAGYEGKGKALASGGAFIIYDLNSQHLGSFNAQSVVRTRWRHVIGSEGVCKN
jgi:hypothetical protein